MQPGGTVSLQIRTFIALGYAVFGQFIQSCGCSGAENDLVKFLTKEYNSQVRPVRRVKDPLVVRVGLSLVDVIKLDDANGQLTVKIWLTMIWKDDYLTWNPDHHGGVRRLNFDTGIRSRVWLPDVMLFNDLRSEVRDPDRIQAVGYFDGRLHWVQPMIVTVGCRHEFRGNSWVAVLKFGSWTYDSKMVDLQPIPAADSKGRKVDIETENFAGSDQWTLLDHTGQRQIKSHECCTEPYVTLQYVVKLRKKVGPSLVGR